MPNRLIAAVLALAVSGAATAARADSPLFVGKWHWNPKESSTAPGEPLPRDVVLNIANADKTRVQWTVTTVDGKGAQTVKSFAGTGDGKSAPIAGDPGTTGAFTLTDTAMESVYASADGGTDRSTCSVSSDRRKLTCRGTESDGKGHSTNYTDVYDRQ
jgi:hypothetical protein